MMNMFRRLRRKKGFTLTELIVVTAIIALLMTCVAAFSQPIRSMSRGVQGQSDSLKICEIVGNYLERRIAYADMVDVFVGYDGTELDVKSKFEELINEDPAVPTTVKPDSQYTKGMLVLHYEPHTDAPEKSTFVLYDVPIKDDDTAIPADLDSYRVFTEDFYNGYSIFMTTDEKMNGSYYGNVNNLTHNAFFSFRLMAYDFKDAGTGITDEIITNYYDYINTGGDTDPTDALIASRTAVENVSFTFENITIGRNSNGIYQDYVETNKVNVKRTNTETDTIIFYAVKDYKSLDIKA